MLRRRSPRGTSAQTRYLKATARKLFRAKSHHRTPPSALFLAPCVGPLANLVDTSDAKLIGSVYSVEPIMICAATTEQSCADKAAAVGPHPWLHGCALGPRSPLARPLTGWNAHSPGVGRLRGCAGLRRRPGTWIVGGSWRLAGGVQGPGPWQLDTRQEAPGFHSIHRHGLIPAPHRPRHHGA